MYSSVVDAVLRHAETMPEKICLVDDAGAVTYREYAEKIRRFASAFAALGIQPGDRVLAEASQRIDFLAAELALHLIGAIFVPVEHRSAPPKIRGFAASSGARMVMPLKEDAYDAPVCMTLDAFVAEAEKQAPLAGYSYPSGETVNSILYSTGTTGAEKGITITHGNDVALCENVICGVEMQEDNVEFILSPFNHSHGLRRYYANMYRGASVLMMENIMNLKRFFAYMQTYQVNSMDLVPSALAVILKLSGDRLGEYRDQLRYVQLGGAPMIRDSKEKLKSLLPHTHLYNIYGSTESGISCIYDFNRPDEKENCIGRPAVNADHFIVDEEWNPIESSKDNPGFLACRGPINMVGYWQDPEETARVLRNGVVYTNDMAYFDEDGDIILLGRKGDVINVGGKKVSPLEIEKAAGTIPEIADCGCVPVEHPGKGSVPKLFVQMKPGAGFDPSAIRARLSELLEPFKVPDLDLIVQIEKIPRTYKGSLQRAKLRELN